MRNPISQNIIYRVLGVVLKNTGFSGYLIIVLQLIKSFFPAFITLLSTQLFDSVFKLVYDENYLGKTVKFASLLLLGYIINYVINFFASIMINSVIYEKSNHLTRGMLYEKCSRLKLIAYEDTEFLNKKKCAEECVKNKIFSQLFLISVNIVINFVSIFTVIFVLFTYNYAFLPICLLSVLPYLVIRILRGREFYVLKKHQAKDEREKAYYWEVLTKKRYIREIRLFGAFDYISSKWRNVKDKVNNQIWALTKKDACSIFLCEVFKTLGYACCLILACIITVQNKITIGMLSSCIYAFSSVQNSLKNLFVQFGNLYEKVKYVKDFFDFLDMQEDTNQGFIKIKSIKKIELKNACFRYPNMTNDVLHNISFSINAGEKIAIVGENGSGKSTLAKILLGFYEIDKGEITINGHNFLDIDRESFNSNISMVSQNYIKYNLTYRENIAISDIDEKKNDKRIIKTITQMGATPKMLSLNLDKLLGVDFGGEELSGGEWQKIAIQRCYFKDSNFIVLDEPTSSLDPFVESEVLRNFVQITQNKTTIIISHRIALCQFVDKILVMKNGRIVEFGSHNELLNNDNEYKKLYNMQQKWYL